MYDIYLELVNPNTLAPMTQRIKAAIKGDKATVEGLNPYHPFTGSTLRVTMPGHPDHYAGIDPPMIATPEEWRTQSFTVSIPLAALGLPSELERLRLQVESLSIQFTQAMDLLVENGIDTSSIGHAKGTAKRVNGIAT